MITSGPEFDKFLVEPGMEIEPFDQKLTKEIFLNHPYKILLHYLEKHPPGYSYWENEGINDFYFKMLDDYNRYGVSFKRENNLFPDNNLYVIKNDNSKKPKYELRFDSNYDLLFNNRYNKKTLLFNKVKKIDLNKYDSGKKPLSEEEKEKRKFIRKPKNKHLQAAMMDPDVYNNNKLFNELMKESDYYYRYLNKISDLLYIDDEDKEKKYFKEQFQKQIDMIKKLHYRINEGNNDYLGIID